MRKVGLPIAGVGIFLAVGSLMAGDWIWVPVGLVVIAIGGAMYIL